MIRSKPIFVLLALINLFASLTFAMGDSSDGGDGSSSYMSTSSTVHSNYSDTIFKGSFGGYLEDEGALTRYQLHRPEDSNWRIQLRDAYLEEVRVYVMSQYANDRNDICTDCQGVRDPIGMAAILADVHAAAVIAYPEDLFHGDNVQTISNYRHKFCKIYIEAIQGCNTPCGLVSQLKPEASYINKIPSAYSASGSVRPDVYWQEKGHVFDYKFMGGRVNTTTDVAN